MVQEVLVKGSDQWVIPPIYDMYKQVISYNQPIDPNFLSQNILVGVLGGVQSFSSFFPPCFHDPGKYNTFVTGFIAGYVFLVGARFSENPPKISSNYLIPFGVGGSYVFCLIFIT